MNTSSLLKTASLALALLLAGTQLSAQEHAALEPAAKHHACEEYAPGDIVTPHITDSHCLEYPGFPKFWEPHELELPRWTPIHVGNVEIDLSPTRHVVYLLLAAVLCFLVLISAARAHVRHTSLIGRPKGGFANGIEAMVLYIRQEVALPNLGHHGEKYVPFVLTLFWFILFANILGLIPYGSTATGNISVTATLAIITFFMVEIAGIRANGIGYLNTIFYWNKELPVGVREFMFLLMTPVEIIGKFSKPFALAIRLFANMTAGHIVVLGMVSLIFAFASAIVSHPPFTFLIVLPPILMATAIMVLELFVSFLQAFIFSLLASVFIGTIRAHH
ncbi:MAG: F0F1 ATP synthase subunit A [Gemmatimonadota bacterium]